MAQTNYTPIQLYYSSTAAAVPVNTNLLNGELAINITDGKLYYKDNSGTVQVIATKGAGTIGGSTTQIQYNNAGALAGSSAMTFNNSTNVVTLTTLNLTNALGAIYGGTGLSTYTTGDLLYSSASNTLAKLAIGTANYILTVNSGGTNVQWSAPSSISVSTATNLAGGVAGSVPYQSGASTTTFLGIGAADRVMTSSGSAPQWVTALTGLTGVSSSSITNTSLTSGRVVYSGTGGLQTNSANLTFDGTTLTTTGVSNTGTSTIVKLLTVGNTSFNGTTVFAAATPAKLYMGTGTVTDVTSAVSATNTTGAIASLAITPIAASNTGVTYTNASTLYIAGAPSAGTNITITNPYALYVNAGASYLGGNTSVTAANVVPAYDTKGNLSVSTTNAQAAGIGGSITLGGFNDNSASTFRVFGSIVGAKSNSSTGDSIGYLAFNVGGGGGTLPEIMRATTTGLAVTGAVSISGSGEALTIGSNALAANTAQYFRNTSGYGALALTSAADQYLTGSVAGDLVIGTNAKSLRFGNLSTGVLGATLNASGNLGIGTSSPSAWTTYKVLQVGNASLAYNNNNTYIGANWFYDGTNKYIAADHALLYSQENGVHGWFTAPSGANANDPITFTQAMTLNSSGNLYLGAISSALANENILTGGQGGGIQLIRNASGNPTSGQSLGTYAWKGTDGANSNAAAEAMIEAVAAENFSGVAAGTNMLFYTKAIGTGPGSAPSERARFNSTGALVFAGGTTTANGIGITFPATQSASTNANTLDDYEEGSWTPVIERLITNPTVTYSFQTGTYVKVGRIVTLTGGIGWSANSGGSSLFTLSGLPFVNSGSTSNYTQAHCIDYSGITFSVGATSLGGYVVINSGYVIFTSGGSAVTSAGPTLGSSGYVYMTITYIASA
jgi:hypothetical protein